MAPTTSPPAPPTASSSASTPGNGGAGYRNVMQNCHDNAMVLKEGLENTGRFSIASKDMGVPVVAFSLKDRSRHDEFEVSKMLRRFGWMVPAYPMPEGAKHVSVLRVVIREDFSRILAGCLVQDIVKVLEELDSLHQIKTVGFSYLN
ncbi:glutamate decarboxylase 3-like [Cucurbita pepo subsp. pepo]|uniref:glutamate decarboxylase 3-like n=1 Tax=Cucurbita pepo subsp. pepo TaxID=3664 RepID=UPI000C9D5486|nr:glutamate decarboxylase 3-like [Cucurbita pepo subsp. pepo]